VKHVGELEGTLEGTVFPARSL